MTAEKPALSLKLKKPLVFLDVEATGLHLTKDRIVEIACLKVNPDGSEQRKDWKINPQKSLPAKIAKLIGVDSKFYDQFQPFEHHGREVNEFIKGCDLAGFNLRSLDLPMLMEEFVRVGIDFDLAGVRIIDVQRIFHTMEKRNLAAAFSFYCGKDLTDGHSAATDTDATFEVFQAQLKKYESLGDTVDSIHKTLTAHDTVNIDLVGRLIEDESGEAVFNFGRYKGRKVKEVLAEDPGYYGWMMNGDFTSFTKRKLTEIRLSMRG